MIDAFDASLRQAFRRSPLGERITRRHPSIGVQRLVQSTAWNGFKPWWLDGFRYIPPNSVSAMIYPGATFDFHTDTFPMPTGDMLWSGEPGTLPGPGYREMVRRRYARRAVSWTDLGPEPRPGGSYSLELTVENPGQNILTPIPRPRLESYYPPWVMDPWPGDGHAWWPTSSLAYGGGWDVYPFADTVTWTTTAVSIDDVASGSEEISDPIAVSSILLAPEGDPAPQLYLLTRLRARSWPAFDWPGDWPEGQAVWTATHFDVAKDGSPYVPNDARYPSRYGPPPPDFGAPHGVGSDPLACSYWEFTNTWEEEPWNDMAGCGLRFPSSEIWAARARFRLNADLSYWFGFALLGRVWGSPLDQLHNPGRLMETEYLLGNTGMKGEIIEVPGPWDIKPGSSTWVVSGNDLSHGAVVFAVIGESPTAWQARTGVSLSGAP